MDTTSKKPDQILVEKRAHETGQYLLSFSNEWRTFTTKKVVANPPDMRVFIEIDNVKEVAFQPKGIRDFFEDWMCLEYSCWHDGIAGWLCAVEKGNPRMLRCVLATGADQYREDDQYRYFQRSTLLKPEPMSFHQFNQRARTFGKGESAWLN